MLRDVREGQVTFHLEEATIDDLHRAIRAGKTNCVGVAEVTWL